MAILFYNNATPVEKWYSLVILALAGLSAYGMGSNFVSEPWTHKLAPLVAVPVSLSLFALLIFDRRISVRIRAASLWKKLWLYPLALATFLLTSWGAVSPGATGLLNELTGEKLSVIVVVTDKSAGTFSRYGCDYHLTVEIQSTGWDGKQCTNEVAWAATEIGKELHAVILQSKYGARVVSLTE